VFIFLWLYSFGEAAIGTFSSGPVNEQVPQDVVVMQPINQTKLTDHG